MSVSKIFKRAAIGLTLLFGSNVAIADCGDVVLAEMNWASAEFMDIVVKCQWFLAQQ
jgi:ABC-type proline/glycine betaine transport system substrate-binding protein